MKKLIDFVNYSRSRLIVFFGDMWKKIVSLERIISGTLGHTSRLIVEKLFELKKKTNNEGCNEIKIL